MPRFFFHVHDDRITLDEEGAELPTAEAAREHAIRAARELACHEVLEGHLGLAHRIEVADQYGGEVATVRFKDVIEIHP
jgi:hypothetical protein